MVGFLKRAIIALAFLAIFSTAFAAINAPQSVKINSSSDSFDVVVFNDSGKAQTAIVQLFAPGIQYSVSPDFASLEAGQSGSFTITIIDFESFSGRNLSGTIVATLGSEQRKTIGLEFANESNALATGATFAFLPISGISPIDWGLIIIILILAIALFARVIHRIK